MKVLIGCPHCGKEFEEGDACVVGDVCPPDLVERIAMRLWAKAQVVWDREEPESWESTAERWREDYRSLAREAVQEIWGSED